MLRQNQQAPKPLVWLLVIFVVATGALLFVFRRASVAGSSLRPETAGTRGIRDYPAPSVSKRINGGDASVEVPSADSSKGISIATLKELAVLKAEKGVITKFPFVLRNLKLSPKFVAVFGLSHDEAERLETNVGQVVGTLEEASLASSSVHVVSNDVVEIIVRPFGGGGVIYDSLMTALEDSLGKDRARLFVKMEQESIDYVFRHYGAEERTLRVEREGPARYKVVEKRESGDDILVTNPAIYPNRSRLQDDFGRIVTLIPADFIP